MPYQGCLQNLLEQEAPNRTERCSPCSKQWLGLLHTMQAPSLPNHTWVTPPVSVITVQMCLTDWLRNLPK